MDYSPNAFDRAGFQQAWPLADAIPGWLTDAQGRALWDAATALPPGALVVEIGSHQGRSTVVLARAVQPKDGTVYAIDPFVDGRLFGGQSTRDKFESNIARAEVADTVELVTDYSMRLRPSWAVAPVDLLYIDGKHDYWTLSDDLRWANFLRDDGLVLIHDCFSSIGVTLGVLRHLLPGSTLRYEGRAGSLATFRKAPPTRADRVRIVAEMPWWIRNVGIKVLLRLRLRRLARLVGHDSPYDPY